MAYSPPPGSAVSLIFLTGYTTPAGGSVLLEFVPPPSGTITAPSIGDGLAFGSANVYGTQIVTTAGAIPAGLFGTPEVDYTRIRVVSIDEGGVGTPALIWTQFLVPESFESYFGNDDAITVSKSGRYAAPYASAIELRFGSAFYGAPTGSVVGLEFEWPYLQGIGINAGAFGTALVAQPGSTQYLTTFDIPPPPFGTASVANRSRFILTGGIAANPLTGVNALREVPDPGIEFRNKYTLPIGIAPPPSQFGPHNIAGFYQVIDQPIFGSEVFGAHFITYRVRFVYPAFLISDTYGTPLVGRNIIVSPLGFGGETFPTTHTIEPYVDRVFLNTGSTDQAAYGIANLRNQRDFLYHTSAGAPSSQFSVPIIYNKRQQITALPYLDTSGETAEYGTPTIINRNRVLTTFGHQSSRFSYFAANVYNNARAISPTGLDTLWGTALVAYRIRNVYMEGLDSSYVTPTAIVHNSARVLHPSGFRNDVVGSAATTNLNRTIGQFFPYEGPSFGTAFIAYRIRYLGPFSLNDIPAAFPELRLDPFPITPVGIDSYRTGGHDLIEHFNIVAPKSVNVPPVPRIGDANIQNRNKTVAPYAYEQTTFGVQNIQNYKRYVNATLGNTAVFGLAGIADNRRTVVSTPFTSHVVSMFARVRNVIPDPPGQQNIVVAFGIESPVPQVSPPILNYLTIFTIGIYEGLVRPPSVRINSMQPPSIPFDDYMGTPTVTGAQYLYPKQIPWPSNYGLGDSDEFRPRPRLSPYTIYAPNGEEATAQAKANHPGGTGLIDADLWSSTHFGTLRIENFNRSIALPTIDEETTARYGFGLVELRTRRIYPVTIRSFRAGTATLNAAQEIKDVSVGISSLIDTHRIHDPTFIPTIAPVGIEPPVISNTDIMLLNRQVYPVGINEEINEFGQGRWGVPMMGFTRIREFEGYVATLWGVPRVEYRNRFVHPVGTNMFLSANTLYGFNQRMRVKHAPQAIRPVGLLATRFGNATIS